MSSPPRVDFPTSDLDDVDINGPPQEGSAEQQTMTIVPQKLFLEGTPSVTGTPARQRYAASTAASSPLTGVVPSRAYIMFKNNEILATFSQGYDGHIFKDKAGAWHSPTS